MDLLITTPETALALQRRLALRADALAAVLLAWPEGWEDEESLAPLMQDLEGRPAHRAHSADRHARRRWSSATRGAR